MGNNIEELKKYILASVIYLPEQEGKRIDIKAMLADPVIKHDIKEYYQEKGTDIDALRLSARSENSLKRSGVLRLGEALNHYPDNYIHLQNIGRSSAEEICGAIESFIEADLKVLLSGPEPDDRENKALAAISKLDIRCLDDPVIKQQVQGLLSNVPADRLNLSPRAYNCFCREGIRTLGVLVDYYPEKILGINQLGVKTANEIISALDTYITENSSAILKRLKECDISVPTETDTNEYTARRLLSSMEYGEAAREYIRLNDVSIKDMDLSVRAYNGLRFAGISRLSYMLSYYPNRFYDIPNLGSKSVEEIKTVVEEILAGMSPGMARYCFGNNDLQPDEDLLRSHILNLYKDLGFRGLSLKEIRSALPEGTDESLIKTAVGSLLAENELEYVDYRCYRVYPTFESELDKYTEKMHSQNKDILMRRLNGATLEEIGNEYGITRERVRQICKKEINRILGLRDPLSSWERKSIVLDEDFYAYLFSNYEFCSEFWTDYLKVSDISLSYLKAVYKSGHLDLSSALEDKEVAPSIKAKLMDYLNRDMIYVEGTLLKHNKSGFEEYYLSRYCHDDVSFDDYVKGFNAFLDGIGLGDDKKLLYSDDVIATRANHLTDSYKVLWKSGRILRYYDIAARDYTELLDTLNLDAYHDTEISTQKFIEDYPELMERYDIRDQYELHNLIKKVVPSGGPNDFQAARQPILRFGSFDRKKAVSDIISALAPVSLDDLVGYIHMEYGYNEDTVKANLLPPFSRYYHNGVYSINFKKIPEDRAQVLKDNLTDDFYYMEEIRKTYIELFPGADGDEINPLSLKGIGFTVGSDYALQNYTSIEKYITDLLTKEDVFSIAPIRDRFCRFGAYYSVYYTLKSNRDIIPFDKDQYISIRRLEDFGITKADLNEYCDLVEMFTGGQKYFNVYSMRSDGFVTKLDDLGFGDEFYSAIISTDNKKRFSTLHVYGATVFCGVETDAEKTRKAFVRDIAGEFDSIEPDSLLGYLRQKYGIVSAERYDIISAVNDSDMYYDPIMDKIYLDKDRYYQDIEEDYREI